LGQEESRCGLGGSAVATDLIEGSAGGMQSGREPCVRTTSHTRYNYFASAIHCIAKGLNPAARARHEDGTNPTLAGDGTVKSSILAAAALVALGIAAERDDTRIAASLNLSTPADSR
jgi:hypothetical protein